MIAKYSTVADTSNELIEKIAFDLLADASRQALFVSVANRKVAKKQ